MKRLQIYIDEELDEALAQQAVRLGTSKAALIRQYVRDQLAPEEGRVDALDALVGSIGDVEPGLVDDVVYGR